LGSERKRTAAAEMERPRKYKQRYVGKVIGTAGDRYVLIAGKREKSKGPWEKLFIGRTVEVAGEAGWFVGKPIGDQWKLEDESRWIAGKLIDYEERHGMRTEREPEG